MREIKFRGKRTDTGKWVYGSLLQWKDGDATICANESENNNVLIKHDVNPDTVGQYTGKKDRNGKEIYWGDLLKSGDVIFEVWWSEDTLCYMLDMVNPSKEMAARMSDLNNTDMEVIGNHWDNLELLKEGK